MLSKSGYSGISYLNTLASEAPFYELTSTEKTAKEMLKSDIEVFLGYGTLANFVSQFQAEYAKNLPASVVASFAEQGYTISVISTDVVVTPTIRNEWWGPFFRELVTLHIAWTVRFTSPTEITVLITQTFILKILKLILNAIVYMFIAWVVGEVFKVFIESLFTESYEYTKWCVNPVTGEVYICEQGSGKRPANWTPILVAFAIASVVFGVVYIVPKYLKSRNVE